MYFKNITDVDQNLQSAVRGWRNHDDIRKNMYSDQIISENDHEHWLKSLQNTNKTKVYIAYKGDDAIGIASVSNLCSSHQTADWAFYLNPKFLTASGLGTLMEFHFLNFIFNEFDLQKLNCEVLACNQSVIKLHKKFGFTEEGVKRQNIMKDGARIDVHLLGILKDEWLNHSPKFEKIIARLER